MFSKSSEYAIRSAIYIAINSRNGTRLGIKEIAEEIDSPMHFTAKVLQTLTKNNIISSVKGPNGGFFLSPDSAQISIIEIVNAVDGQNMLKSCVLGLKICSSEFPCPLHNQISAYKERLSQIFEKTTIQDLANDISSGKYYLKNLTENMLSDCD